MWPVGTLEGALDLPGEVKLLWFRPKSHLLYGEDTVAIPPPPELTEMCGGRRVSEVASGWPYVVWLYFTGRRVAVEL